MASRWSGRVALVTGASAGIGFAVTKQLAQLGMKIVGCDIAIANVQDLAKDWDQSDVPGSVYAITCDVSKEDQVLAMFAEIKDKFGGVDVCINSAGLGRIAPLLDGGTEEWRHMLDVNVLGLCMCTREAVKSMRERNVDDGHVVNLCSMSGHRISPSAATNFYAATKFAVKALTEGLRQELREIKSNIRISSISPATVNSNFFYSMFGKEMGESEYNILEKNLEPKDIADAIVFALQAPPHVQIHDILIRTTEQKD